MASVNDTNAACRDALHVCFVSEQVPANLIPALKLKPARVLLLASAAMKEPANALQRVLREHGIESSLWDEPLHDHNSLLIHAQAQRVVEHLVEAGVPVVLNATGGNKLMVLAFWQALAGLTDERLRVLYCDTLHNHLEYLLPVSAREPIGQVLSLRDGLGAYGYRIVERRDQVPAWREGALLRKPLSKWLAANLHRDTALLGALNGASADALAAAKRADVAGLRQSFRSEVWGLWLETLRHIARTEYELVDWKEGDDALIFRGAAAAQYLCGGWLEEFAWHCAVDARCHEAASSLTIRHRLTETPDTKTDNELDVAVMHDNRLLVLECKTAVLAAEGQALQDVLHKLDNVGAHAGGLMAERWLLSVRRVPELIRARARAYRIRIVEGEDVASLPDLLRARFSGPH